MIMIITLLILVIVTGRRRGGSAPVDRVAVRHDSRKWSSKTQQHNTANYQIQQTTITNQHNQQRKTSTPRKWSSSTGAAAPDDGVRRRCRGLVPTRFPEPPSSPPPFVHQHVLLILGPVVSAQTVHRCSVRGLHIHKYNIQTPTHIA